MHRLLGKAKPKTPAPTLDDVSQSLESRSTTLLTKIESLDAELLKIKQQLKTARPGPSKQMLQKRGLQLLQSKRLYEKQREALFGQQMNIDQTKFAQQNVKDTIQHVEALKTASTELKSSMKQMKIDKIEDLHDNMSDMLEDVEDINEIMARSYATPEYVDESDLLAELDQLDEEEALNEDTEQEQVPSYLLNAATASRQTATASTAPSTTVYNLPSAGGGGGSRADATPARETVFSSPN